MRDCVVSFFCVLTSIGVCFSQENVLAELPAPLPESSGLILVGDLFLSFNTSSGQPEVYVINNSKGGPKLIDTIELHRVSQKEGIYYSTGALSLPDEYTFLSSIKLDIINYLL